jgi:hypothetical protein
MHSLTDGDVIDNSDVNHLKGGLQPRGEMIDHLDDNGRISMRPRCAPSPWATARLDGEKDGPSLRELAAAPLSWSSFLRSLLVAEWKIFTRDQRSSVRKRALANQLLVANYRSQAS